jgi:hypothetical protein
VSKSQVVEAIRTAAQKLGRLPKVSDLEALCGITRQEFRRRFPSMRQAVRAAGLEPSLEKVRISTADLLTDWGEVARKMGRVPSSKHYVSAGKYSLQSYHARFGSWKRTPELFRNWVREGNTELQERWQDVLAMVDRRIAAVEQAAAEGPTSTPTGEYLRRRSAIFPERPVFGAPMLVPGLSYEPVNESGVIYLFGLVAKQMGFQVERFQVDFPDCEAMRELQPGKWQRVRVEFEYESKNFRTHKHPPAGCDLIICWRHNWPECPTNLEVIELSRVVGKAALTADSRGPVPPAPACRGACRG